MADISTDKYKQNYITLCGLESPVRFGTAREIDLSGFLPDYLKDTDTLSFVNLFQNFYNTLFDGLDGYTYSETEVSAGLSAISYGNPTLSATRKISILEKINRLTELHDPNLIDIEFLQYFASNLGYNLDINRGELGSYASNNPAVCSATDTDRYLRFVISNLPHWYKIKTTRNAVKVMLYSFGLIGDISYYYTDSYLPEVSGGKWEVPDYTMNASEKYVSSLPSNFYPTPHFILWADVDEDSNNLSWDYDRRTQIINSIDSIKPINTVFRHLGAYVKRIFNIYTTGYVRFRRHIYIPNSGNCDWWNT